MRCEIMDLKRCCFCIPLRYGLIVWAYFKLAIGIALMLYFMMILKAFIQLLFQLHDKSLITADLAIAATIFIIIVVDNVLCVVFLVSAHRKLYRIMRVYYIYLLVILGLTIPLFMSFFVIRLLSLSKKSSVDKEIVKTVAQSIAEIINIVLQIYFIILVRSEIRKLSRNCQFRFSNNAAQPECAMITTTVYEKPGEVLLKNNETSESDQRFHVSEKKPLGSEKTNY